IGKEIRGLESFQNRRDLLVLHAGTKKDQARFVSWGGRVLNVIALGPDLEAAVKRAYEAIPQLQMDGMIYRKDIGFRALKRPVTK
ncbi:MAG: phosphoribosylamine--glycine ligase, partial [Candidatus Omnitrophica bacterium]|nr:phosphoribosylamine--glycine ligase [Candidatus Omnitrophota bacterium]